jgi:hypothetical protein
MDPASLDQAMSHLGIDVAGRRAVAEELAHGGELNADRRCRARQPGAAGGIFERSLEPGELEQVNHPPVDARILAPGQEHRDGGQVGLDRVRRPVGRLERRDVLPYLAVGRIQLVFDDKPRHPARRQDRALYVPTHEPRLGSSLASVG